MKNDSFWNGFWQGLSGPALLGSRPAMLGRMVDSDGRHVRLILPYRRSRPDGPPHAHGRSVIAEAISGAVDVVMRRNGLSIAPEIVKRLDSQGKMRETNRPKVQRRAANVPE